MLTLSPPRLITFGLSALMIGLAVASLYMRIPVPKLGPFVASHRTGFMIGAWAVLALGVLSRRL